MNAMSRFWKELGHCLKSSGNERRLFLFGDMNAKAGNVVIRDVVGKWDVVSVNENGHYTVDICVREGAVLSKHFLSGQDNTYVSIHG